MEKQKFLKLRISEDLYEMFQDTCESRNKTMSEVLRNFSKFYIESDNVVLLDMEDELLKQTVLLCKEKGIKFEDLMIYLIKKAIKNKDKLNF